MPDARKKLLADMTEDVAAASLRNNYQQSLALSLAERRSARDLPDYALLMRALKSRGLLTRSLEALPDDSELLERGRAGRGLTRPELAVLLSYRQDRPAARPAAKRGAGRAAARELAHGLFPAAPARALRAGHRQSQPAPRDHRAGPHQRRRQPRRSGHGGAARRRDAPARRRMSRTPSWRRARCSICRSCGSASTRSTARCRARRSLRLYEATQDLVNAQTLWFLRNGAALTDLTGTIARHKAGLAALKAAARRCVCRRAAGRTWSARRAASAKAAFQPTLPPTSPRSTCWGWRRRSPRSRQTTGQPVPAAARAFLEIGEHLRIRRPRRQGRRHCHARLLRPPRHRPGARASSRPRRLRSRAMRIAATRTGRGLARRPGRPARPRQQHAGGRSPAGEGTLTVSRLLVAAGQLSELAAAPAAPSASARTGRAAGPARSAASGSLPARKPARPPRS